MLKLEGEEGDGWMDGPGVVEEEFRWQMGAELLLGR